MLAKINTKSNYRELNGTIQTVKEIVGNRVTCMIFAPEFGKYIQADFTLNECDIIAQSAVTFPYRGATNLDQLCK